MSVSNHYHGMPQTETKVTRRVKILRLPPGRTLTVVGMETQKSSGTRLEIANQRAPAAGLKEISGKALSLPYLFQFT